LLDIGTGDDFKSVEWRWSRLFFFLIYAIGSRVDMELSRGPYERLSPDCKVDLVYIYGQETGRSIGLVLDFL
jgi:hypothetical protein